MTPFDAYTKRLELYYAAVDLHTWCIHESLVLELRIERILKCVILAIFQAFLVTKWVALKKNRGITLHDAAVLDQS